MEIYTLLPHRFPFLMIDRVLSCERGRSLHAVKNVSLGEPCFQGHFPDRPIFPGILILEAVAQASHILLIESLDEVSPGGRCCLTAIRSARFRRTVLPGDQLHIAVRIVRKRGGVARFGALVTVRENLVCQTLLTCVRKEKRITSR